MQNIHQVVTAKKTPNCVNCSRSIEHIVCSVLHLLDDGWLLERGPRSEYAATTLETGDRGPTSARHW
jgi:hypothetical protein